MKGKLIKQKGIGFQTIDGSDYFLTIDEKVYHTNPLTAGLVDGGKLSYKNCQAIERGYDLDELLKKEIANGKLHPNDGAKKEGIERGIQIALEIFGDKKFSEEDIREAYSRGQTNSPIQSLQQTEWDVEIETVPALSNNGNVYYGDIPKFDDEGCLILKKYKNG